MKSLINIIIFLVVAFLAIKFFIWILPVIIVAGVGIWIYSRYKIKKVVKEFEENNNQYKTYTKSEDIHTKKDDIDKEDKFNGTVIDVDFEDVKKD